MAPRRHHCHGDKMVPICPKMVQFFKWLTSFGFDALETMKSVLFISCCIYTDKMDEELLNIASPNHHR